MTVTHNIHVIIIFLRKRDTFTLHLLYEICSCTLVECYNIIHVSIWIITTYVLLVRKHYNVIAG